MVDVGLTSKQECDWDNWKQEEYFPHYIHEISNLLALFHLLLAVQPIEYVRTENLKDEEDKLHTEETQVHTVPA